MRARVHTAALIEASRSARELWPLADGPPEGAGWFAYAPGSGTAYGSSLAVEVDDTNDQD